MSKIPYRRIGAGLLLAATLLAGCDTTPGTPNVPTSVAPSRPTQAPALLTTQAPATGTTQSPAQTQTGEPGLPSGYPYPGQDQPAATTTATP